MRIFEYCPPSGLICAAVAVTLTLKVGVAAGIAVTLAWWAGYELDTYGLLG